MAVREDEYNGADRAWHAPSRPHLLAASGVVGGTRMTISRSSGRARACRVAVREWVGGWVRGWGGVFAEVRCSRLRICSRLSPSVSLGFSFLSSHFVCTLSLSLCTHVHTHARTHAHTHARTHTRHARVARRPARSIYAPRTAHTSSLTHTIRCQVTHKTHQAVARGCAHRHQETTRLARTDTHTSLHGP